MNTATPDLSSAPSRFVPSDVMIVPPISCVSSGLSATRSTFEGSPGSTRSDPSQLACTTGFTLVSEVSGDVSTWATSGNRWSVVRHGGRYSSHHHSKLRKRHIGKPHRLALTCQQVAEFQLLRRTRASVGMLIRLCIDVNVGKKTIRERYRKDPSLKPPFAGRSTGGHHYESGPMSIRPQPRVGLTNDAGRSLSFRVAHLAALSAKCGVSSSQWASAQN